jgi:hypothetical protein
MLSTPSLLFLVFHRLFAPFKPRVNFREPTRNPLWMICLHWIFLRLQQSAAKFAHDFQCAFPT